MTADRNLLLGILALQNNFIDRHQLIAAFDRWTGDKSRPLSQILLEQGAIAADEHELLEALVAKHLQRHGGDPERSLADLTPVDSMRDDLQRLGDGDVAASLAHMVAVRGDNDLAATQTWAAGEATSAGMRFRILRPHARGGLGEVYVARDEELHREVALKEIQPRHAHDLNSRSRFLLEAEITGGLEHPGIVPVYGLGTYADGRPFYAMRFIKGDSLKEAIERFHQGIADFSSLEFRKLLGRFVDVCNAIEYAHSRGVLHRDLKPGNIMLGKYGETLVVDWGLAKVVGRPEMHASADELTIRPSSGSGSAPTQIGSAVGTPQYMSPEQAEGRLDRLGPATDVYSLGATLYTLLTARAPFRDAELIEVLLQVSKGDFTAPRGINTEIPRALEAICLNAMSLAAADRYRSPRALADDIEHWLADEPVTALRDTFADRAARWTRRHRALARSAALALLAISVVSITAALVVDTARRDQKTARVAADRAAESERQQTKRAQDEAQNALLAETKARQEAQRAEANRIEAERQTGIAQRHARVSEALRLVGESQRERPEHPVRSVLLALEAARLAGDEQDVTQSLNESIGSIGGEPLALGTTPALLTLSPEGDWLAAGNAHGTIRAWNLMGDPHALAFKPDMSPVTELAFSADSRWLASAHGDCAIRMWDLTRSDPSSAPLELLRPAGIPALLRFSPDGAWLVGCDQVGTIRRWDARRPEYAPVLLHQETVNEPVNWRDEPGAKRIKFSRDGRWLAAITDGINVSVWSFRPDDAEPRRFTFKAGTGDLPSVGLPIFALSDNSRWLATVGDDGIRLWDLEASDPSTDPLILEKCSGDINDVGYQSPEGSFLAFSSDGRWLAACNPRGGDNGWSTRLWDLGTRNPADSSLVVKGADDDEPRGLKFSSDSGWLVQNCQDRLRLWKMSARGTERTSASLTLGAEALEAEGHAFVTFATSGRYLAGGSDDGSVRVWDLAAEDPAASPDVLHGHDSPIATIIFLTDGSDDASLPSTNRLTRQKPAIVTTSEDGALRLWNAPEERFRGSPYTPLMSRARAVELAGRELTEVEIAEHRINRDASTADKRPNGHASNRVNDIGINDALKWIADHQRPDGSWSFDHRSAFLCDGQCRNPGIEGGADYAATGLALRALLGAGRADMNTICKENIYRGLYWLIRDQNGQIGAYGLTDGRAARGRGYVVAPRPSLFSHAVCTSALVAAHSGN